MKKSWLRTIGVGLVLLAGCTFYFVSRGIYAQQAAATNEQLAQAGLQQPAFLPSGTSVAAINLLLLVFTGIVTVTMLIKHHSFANTSATEKSFMILMPCVFVVQLFLFIITESIPGTIIIVNSYSWFHVLLTAVSAAAYSLMQKWQKEEQEA